MALKKGEHYGDDVRQQAYVCWVKCGRNARKARLALAEGGGPSVGIQTFYRWRKEGDWPGRSETVALELANNLESSADKAVRDHFLEITKGLVGAVDLSVKQIVEGKDLGDSGRKDPVKVLKTAFEVQAAIEGRPTKFTHHQVDVDVTQLSDAELDEIIEADYEVQ